MDQRWWGESGITRHLEETVLARLNETPVVVLNGARTVGKSTLMQTCAAARGAGVIDLDDPETRAAVERDPTLFVHGLPEPICFDEFQHVLPLLDAIKAELNQDLRPGRYLLTGSTRYATLPAASQSLTGRAHVVTMWPFSQGELHGHRETFLASLMAEAPALTSAAISRTSRVDYEAMVLAGGFPLAVKRESGSSRSRWFRDFVTMVIERDVLEIRAVRQRGVLPRVLRHLASQTAQVLTLSRIASELGLSADLVEDYVRLMEAVFLVHRLEAYGRTLSTRVRLQPKVHLVDSGLGAHFLGITETRLAKKDPATLTEFGHLLETFAVNEVLKQATWADESFRFSHYRTKDGAEVDLVIEADDGRVAGVEVKASGTVAGADFRGLEQLRGKLGDAFVAGVVLHLGQRSYEFADRLFAVALDRLWS
ncbi:MAG: ATP-binding protein [Candidatus Dormibacteraeota bacterium]|uniref:ATP-binding protein n=1 Tax=Candidatus Aeolococcus gillhamiae TaxID=3127015 RepID=A0A934JTT9_9BACT|nr:ATP-binding protein [Candidatus Dormibacteraeota bacterium]